MNSSGYKIDEDLKNLCSLLLLISPEELLIVSTIISLFLTEMLTTDEQNVIGSLLQAVGGNLQMVSAQEEFFKSINEFKKNNKE